MESMNQHESWGRYPRVRHAEVRTIRWRSEVPDLGSFDRPVLAHGLGRSYGDSCLNHDGVLLVTAPMSRFIDLDEDRGLLRCDAGTTLARIQSLIIPRGFFLPVIPGTKYVTAAGAVANDIHGKNHHLEGTFGCHVTRFELLRSDGSRLICSPEENRELFHATIGGLGLTGFITWVELRIKRVSSPFIAMESIRFDHVDDFFKISAESDLDFEYTVAWIDCTARGRHLGRGIFMRGNHADPKVHRTGKIPKERLVTFPFDAPRFFLNRLTVKAFNILYYRKQLRRFKKSVVYQAPFFHPLDAVLHWNRMYGKEGFLQYQFAVPIDDDGAAVKALLEKISASGLSSFLAVLKVFGDVRSPGMLSFPRPGATLAMDFRYQGKRSLDRLEELDAIVRESGGALYPAKDARMSPESFQTFYPQWREFATYVDPGFSSSFWRRVTREA